MKNTSILIFTVVISVFTTHAQEKSDKAIRIDEVYLYNGIMGYQVQSPSIEELKSFAPGSSILAKNYNGFNNYSNNTYHFTNQSMSGMLGLSFPSQPKMHLRLGLNYRSATNFVSTNYDYNSYAYDTLTSSQTGSNYFLDSTVTKYSHMEQTSEQLSLDASLAFSTNSESRWSLYGGIGLQCGVGFNVSTALSYSEMSSVPNGLYETESGYSLYEREEFKNSNYLHSSVYIPLGIDFRIGKKREFWKIIHLFYEARPAVSFYSSTYWLGNSIQMNFTQGIGLKINW